MKKYQSSQASPLERNPSTGHLELTTICVITEVKNGKWFEPRSLSRLCGLDPDDQTTQTTEARPLWSTSFTCVRIFCRTKDIIMDTIVIQWYVNKWPGILKFSPTFDLFFATILTSK